MKPTLKAPGTKRLKLEHDKLLSNFAFNFNLRRYTKVKRAQLVLEKNLFQLNPVFQRSIQEVGTSRYCPPRHPTYIESLFIELNIIL